MADPDDVTPHALVDAFSDLDAAVLRLENGFGDATEERRALNEVLANLNQIREYHRKGLGGADYFDRAKSREGRVTEALIMVRGVTTHDLTRRVEAEAQGLYPGTFYPGEAYPAENLCWSDATEGLHDPHNRRPDFQELVVGRIVTSTIQDARRFLSSLVIRQSERPALGTPQKPYNSQQMRATVRASTWA